MSAAAPGDGPDPADQPVGSVTEEALRLVEALGGAWGHESHEAPADGVPPPECGWCPVCRTLRALRVTDPEVRAHLSAAGASLMAAVGAMLAPPADVVPRTTTEEDRTKSTTQEDGP